MQPERRRPRFSRRLLPIRALMGIAALCCIPTLWACNPIPAPGDGFGGFGAGAGIGGSFTGTGSSFSTGSTSACTSNELDVGNLRAHYVDPWLPTHRAYYAWVSAEEEAALRAGGPLFPVREEGTIEDHALGELAAWAVGHTDRLEAAIMPTFSGARTVWPRAWPIRLGLEGEGAGDRLVRMDLAEDAWIARLSEHGEIWEVYDLNGYTRTLEEALANPERIALLYFVHLGENAGLSCGAQDRVYSGHGYRQFIAGNEAKLHTYEVGTERTLAELLDDIDSLGQYMEVTRPCPPAIFDPFDAMVVCSWGYHSDPFLDALATTIDAYRPSAGSVADLITLLEDSLFDVDPYLVQVPAAQEASGGSGGTESGAGGFGGGGPEAPGSGGSG